MDKNDKIDLDFLIKLSKGEVRVLPRREGYCPAYPICEKFGNGRKECRIGSERNLQALSSEKCLATVVLILGAVLGNIIEGSPVEKKMKVVKGFRPPSQESEQSS